MGEPAAAWLQRIFAKIDAIGTSPSPPAAIRTPSSPAVAEFEEWWLQFRKTLRSSTPARPQPAASPASASTAAPRAATPSAAPASSSTPPATVARVEPATDCVPPPAPRLVERTTAPSSVSATPAASSGCNVAAPSPATVVPVTPILAAPSASRISATLAMPVTAAAVPVTLSTVLVPAAPAELVPAALVPAPPPSPEPYGAPTKPPAVPYAAPTPTSPPTILSSPSVYISSAFRSSAPIHNSGGGTSNFRGGGRDGKGQPPTGGGNGGTGGSNSTNPSSASNAAGASQAPSGQWPSVSRSWAGSILWPGSDLSTVAQQRPQASTVQQQKMLLLALDLQAFPRESFANLAASAPDKINAATSAVSAAPAAPMAMGPPSAAPISATGEATASVPASTPPVVPCAVPRPGPQQPRRAPDPLRQPQLRLRHPRHARPRLWRGRHLPYLTDVARDSTAGLRRRSSASVPSGVYGTSVSPPNSGGQPPPAAVPHAAAASSATTRATSSLAAPASVLAPRSAPTSSSAAPWAAPPSAVLVSAQSPSTVPYGGGQSPCKSPKQHTSPDVQELLAAPHLSATSPTCNDYGAQHWRRNQLHRSSMHQRPVCQARPPPPARLHQAALLRASTPLVPLVATDAAAAMALVAITPVVSPAAAATRHPTLASKAHLLLTSCRPIHTDMQCQYRRRKLHLTGEPFKAPLELLFLQCQGQASWVSLQQVGRAPPSAPRTIVLVFVVNNVSTLAASQLEDELSSKGGEVLLSVARRLRHARPCPPAATQGIILAVADLCNSIRLQHLHLITGPLSVFDWVYCAFPVTLLRQAMEHIQDTASVLFTSPSAGVRHLQVHLWQELGSSSDGPGSAALLSQHLGSSWPTVVVWCLQHTSMISPFSAGNLLRQPD